MNLIRTIIITIACSFFLFACSTSKKSQTVVNTEDSVALQTTRDSAEIVPGAMMAIDSLRKNSIDYKTFSAKVKLQFEDGNGKQPDANAFIRLQKDSILWVSVSATFLNIEAARILITPSSVTIINKLEKTVQEEPFEFISHAAQIPLTFSTLSDLILGNPLFVGDSIISYGQSENKMTIITLGNIFKNLLTLSTENFLMQRSELTDVDTTINRKANLLYDNYDFQEGKYFSTKREIIITGKNIISLQLDFKQYEFNKELSFPFSIPRNYKKK